jgi:hypothetical protein
MPVAVWAEPTPSWAGAVVVAGRLAVVVDMVEL